MKGFFENLSYIFACKKFNKQCQEFDLSKKVILRCAKKLFTTANSITTTCWRTVSWRSKSFQLQKAMKRLRTGQGIHRCLTKGWLYCSWHIAWSQCTRHCQSKPKCHLEVRQCRCRRSTLLCGSTPTLILFSWKCTERCCNLASNRNSWSFQMSRQWRFRTHYWRMIPVKTNKFFGRNYLKKIKNF